MFDAPAPSIHLQRTRGRAAVALGASGRLTGLHQSGSAKLFLPRIHSDVPEAVFLNTAGGLTGGDRLDYAVELAPGARAVATTQTAERAYASSGGAAELNVTLTLGAGAALDWLPQETILFDRSALARRTVADLAGEARLAMAEMVVLGRAAMGEVIGEMYLADWREVRRDGRPVLVEPLRMTSATLAAGPAVLNGARAFATVALVAPGGEDALGPVRACLVGALPDGVEAAASGWDGKCVVRLLAGDALPLKRAVAAVLDVLRGRPLPRVWQM
ncbi:urease accessory protein UreD [Acidimangrovimonas pyrenivorans]|uniref:Urease accessory protein UreD n=1 Tax=Acidimangrovimonas pyrenivorans TaxID=2030798 RepID=A0ABV7AGF8_9RHOB